ncbi:hypothetical protein V9L05_18090 [Bernardetia sp. Wsw4-3y2]|uniref:hypothetical protein n=1 Tax=Bernardetia sp. Wsw4-3y2 TaxID=3127471 RepID=UPI0030D4685D
MFKSLISKNTTQAKIEQTEGYLILPIVIGILKGVLKNDIIASSPKLMMAVEKVIKEMENDKKIAHRVAHLDDEFLSNGEAKKWSKTITQSIRELSKKGIKEIVLLLNPKDTNIPLTDDEYASIVNQAYTVYLFCPTKKQIEIYRKQIESFDEYVEDGRIILIHSQDLDFFLQIPSVGYFYSPKEVQLSSVNNQKRLTTTAEAQRVIEQNLPSIRLV